MSGLTSLAGGGGVGAGAEAGGGGGGASSFFLQPAKVKAQANTVIIDNDKNSFFMLASPYTKVSQYVYAYVVFTFNLTLAPLLDSFIKAARQFSVGKSSPIRIRGKLRDDS